VKKIILILLLSFLLIAVTITVVLASESKGMLLCLPGFPGTAAQAQPYVDKVFRYLEKELSWANKSLQGHYISDGEQAVKKLFSDKPKLALVGPSIYAGQHKKMGMKVIAKVVANGRGEEIYSVIVKKNGPKTLTEISGKKLAGAVVHDSKYVYNVLLDQKIKNNSLILISQKRPLRSLREVVRGKVDAAIVDQFVVDHMNELPIADDLKIIYKSKPVPAPVAVVMGINKTETKKIQTALIKMCSYQAGKDLCKSLTITSIKRASDATYKDLLERYER